MCAQYIKSLIEGKEYTLDFDLLKQTSGAKFFDPCQQDVFPQRDFDLCTRVNVFDFVLKYENGKIIKIGRV